MRLGARFVALEQDAGHVRAQIEGPDGVEIVRARYLVGCDGGSSSVRTAIGGELFDYGFDEPWLVVDAKVGEDARTPDVNLSAAAATLEPDESSAGGLSVRLGIGSVRATVRRLLQKENDIPVIIQADTTAPTGLLVRVIDEAKLGGAQKVNLATAKPASN